MDQHRVILGSLLHAQYYSNTKSCFGKFMVYIKNSIGLAQHNQNLLQYANTWICFQDNGCGLFILWLLFFGSYIFYASHSNFINHLDFAFIQPALPDCTQFHFPCHVFYVRISSLKKKLGKNPSANFLGLNSRHTFFLITLGHSHTRWDYKAYASNDCRSECIACRSECIACQSYDSSNDTWL